MNILEFVEMKNKIGLAADDMYPDHAVLIPQLLEKIPYKIFIHSSIDALIHAMESFLSPKSNEMTELYSQKAIEIILKGTWADTWV